MTSWKVGDLAVAVSVPKTPKNAHRFTGTNLLQKGKVYVVEAILGPISGELGLVVSVRSPHPTGAWSELQFRKIQHDKREACESDFVKLLNRVKQGERA